MKYPEYGCGTYPGYRQHIRRKETACRACRAARRAYDAAARLAKSKPCPLCGLPMDERSTRCFSCNADQMVAIRLSRLSPGSDYRQEWRP